MHYGGHLREALSEWVCDGMPATATAERRYEDVHGPAEKLLGLMTQCTDIMPSYLCDELDIEPGSTYARAAQRLLAERKRPEYRPMMTAPAPPASPPVRYRVVEARE
jgi:hypothetical protein